MRPPTCLTLNSFPSVSDFLIATTIHRNTSGVQRMQLDEAIAKNIIRNLNSLLSVTDFLTTTAIHRSTFWGSANAAWWSHCWKHHEKSSQLATRAHQFVWTGLWWCQCRCHKGGSCTHPTAVSQGPVYILCRPYAELVRGQVLLSSQSKQCYRPSR